MFCFENIVMYDILLQHLDIPGSQFCYANESRGALNTPDLWIIWGLWLQPGLVLDWIAHFFQVFYPILSLFIGKCCFSVTFPIQIWGWQNDSICSDWEIASRYFWEVFHWFNMDFDISQP